MHWLTHFITAASGIVFTCTGSGIAGGIFAVLIGIELITNIG